MIVLERRLAQLFRAALRRCIDGPPRLLDQTPVLIRLHKGGWTLHARTEEFALVYQQAGPGGKGVFAFPASVLAQFEGKTTDAVEITLQRPDLAQAAWSEKGNPMRIDIPLLEPEKVPILPDLPKNFAPLAPEFLPAFHEATLTTAKDATKYVMNRVQLRGAGGQIVASDSRQLLVQGGFKFPFKEDLLITRCGVFDLAPYQGIPNPEIGKTDHHVMFRLGPWTVALAIDKDGRYPDVNSIIPRPWQNKTRFCLHPDDATAVLETLTHQLRVSKSSDSLVRLCLQEVPRFHFDVDGKIGEIGLPDSTWNGPKLEIGLNLSQFLRAVEQRFFEFEIRDADKPIVCRDGERLYMSMPLTLPVKWPASPEAPPTRVHEEKPVPVPADSRDMAPIPAGRNVRLAPTGRGNAFDVVNEASGLKDAVVKAAGHAGRLLRFLREVCQQPGFKQKFRQSLLALTDYSSTPEQR